MATALVKARHPWFVEADKLEAAIRAQPKASWSLAIEAATADPDVRWVLKERLHLMEHTMCSFAWNEPGKNGPDERHQCQESKGHGGLHLCACGKAERRRTPRE